MGLIGKHEFFYAVIVIDNFEYKYYKCNFLSIEQCQCINMLRFEKVSRKIGLQ